jgi:hypothetical protein
MDALRLCLGLAPVALYLWLLGVRNLSPRPRLVSGVRDSAMLALAVSGLVVVGPIELFFPHEAAVWFGPHVWLLLLALYAMCVVLWLLMSRPRLVIYNVSLNKLRPTLADVVDSLDADARWAGDSLALPGLGVQLYAEDFAVLRGVSLIAAGGKQSQGGWRRLDEALRAALAREEVARDPRGLGLFFAGLLCLAAIGWSIARSPAAAGNSLLDVVHSLLKLLGL